MKGDKFYLYTPMGIDVCEDKGDEHMVDFRSLCIIYSEYNGIGFKLKVIKALNDFPTTGEVFDVWAKAGHYAYSGMWRLFDSGSYQVD